MGVPKPALPARHVTRVTFEVESHVPISAGLDAKFMNASLSALNLMFCQSDAESPMRDFRATAASIGFSRVLQPQQED